MYFPIMFQYVRVNTFFVVIVSIESMPMRKHPHEQYPKRSCFFIKPLKRLIKFIVANGWRVNVHVYVTIYVIIITRKFSLVVIKIKKLLFYHFMHRHLIIICSMYFQDCRRPRRHFKVSQLVRSFARGQKSLLESTRSG